nr:MAG TPA: hypothetical protein [Caudoviricetes sp.]
MVWPYRSNVWLIRNVKYFLFSLLTFEYQKYILTLGTQK